MSQEADSPIGVVDDDLRRKIVERLCHKSGVVDPDCFCEARERVLQTLARDFLPAFLDSPFFIKYQTEFLISDRVVAVDLVYDEIAGQFLRAVSGPLLRYSQ